MSRNDILAWISSLTDKQFVEFFYEAVADRDTADFAEEQAHLVLAETSQFSGEKRRTNFLALPDPEHYPNGFVDDHPICQSGRCGKCGAAVRSIAKRAICPLCGEPVYCT